MYMQEQRQRIDCSITYCMRNARGQIMELIQRRWIRCGNRQDLYQRIIVQLESMTSDKTGQQQGNYCYNHTVSDPHITAFMDNGFHKSVAGSETDTSKKQRDADFPYHQIGTHS